jgi:hypothetical protein
MKLFIVMVNPYFGPRYIDSTWLKKDSAIE